MWRCGNIPKENNMKIIIEQPKNLDCKVIYMDRKLEKDGKRYFSTEYGDKEGFAAYPWLEEMHNIVGVHHISAHNYQIMVIKGRVFSFDNIVPEIEAILQREFPEDLA
jgi:hypothetical protein